MAVTRTKTARGDHHFDATKDYRHGDVVAIDGADGATVDVVAADILDTGTLNLVGVAGAGVNDFDLPDGVHGQELLVVASAIPGGNLTLTEETGTTVVQEGGAAVASVTFDAVGEYALLRFEYNQWRIMSTDATIA
jgi:hypothetical protein